MPSTPILQSQEITLRPFTPDDAPALHTYLNHPELSGRRYIHWDFNNTLPLSHAQVLKLIEKWNEKEEGFCYAVIRNEPEPTLIGHVEADWGWDPHMPGFSLVIAPDHQHQGYGSQVLSLLLNYLYDFTIAHNVSTWIEEWNAPALAFTEKHGFTRAGVVRRDAFRHGQFIDAVVVDMLRPEWKERRHAA